jgi:hypothetical protein
VMDEITAIHQAFMKLRRGSEPPSDDLGRQLLSLLYQSHPRGMTGPEMVERMLGRELTAEEDNLVFLLWEEEGSA